MTAIRRPVVTLPPAPAVYNQKEQNEFRRILMNALGESVTDLVRPSLSVVVTQDDTEYEMVVSYTGTMTYRIDGAPAITGTASPQTITVARNTGDGAAIVYVFTVVNAEQTVNDTVVVLPAPATATPTITIGAQTADDTTDTYTYVWSTANMPGGETYSLEYEFTTTAQTITGIETGTIDPATSGGTVVAGEDIGATPTYRMTVRAFVAGDQIAMKYGEGTFTT